jgi:hypothetical protein
MTHAGGGGSHLQWRTVPGFWVLREHAGIKSSPGRHLRCFSDIGRGNKRTICRNCCHPPPCSGEFSNNHHHPRAVEAVLESDQQRNIFLQVRHPLWPSHSRLQVRYHIPLPLSPRVGDPSPCNQAQEMVAGLIRYF